MDSTDDEEGSGQAETPRHPRIRLDTMERVRREMGAIYLEAKRGHRSTQDASRLANILALIGRIIEGGELEKRLVELEKSLAGRNMR